MDLEGVVREIAVLCKHYGVHTVAGDRYAAGWVRERFKAEGIRYVDAELPVPQEPDAKRYLDKSFAYLEVEPLFAQGRIEVLDHSQLARELKLLERRPRAGGRTLVDHPTGGHDDHGNALALAVALASQARSDAFGSWLSLGIRPQDTHRSSWRGGIEGLAAQLGARYDWRNL